MPIIAQHRDYDRWLIYFREQGEMYVFGYGSLMWKPEVEHDDCIRATAYGVSRRYCIVSTQYRGTSACPGRVLGLEMDAEEVSCHGMVFRMVGAKIPEAFDRLWRREMITDAYLPSLIPVDLDNKNTITSLAFIADPAHPQYALSESPEKVASIIATACGSSGSNLAYFQDTHRHLQTLGVKDNNMDEIAQCLPQR